MTAPDTRTYYKWLGQDGESFHGGRGYWPLPTKRDDGTWEPGAALRVEGEIIPCRHGLHLCREQDLVLWCAPTLWVAQHRGEPVEAEDKIVVGEARLLRQIETWDERTARLFAADCAERALLLAQVTDLRSWAAVEVARRYAIGQATDAELTAARAAAWDAAWDAARAAAWAATWAAAWDATWAAVGDAAWGAARDAAGDAAGAAAWDAAWAAERRWQTARLMAYLRGETPGPVTAERAA